MKRARFGYLIWKSTTLLADLINQDKGHINTLTPAQLEEQKAQQDLGNWEQSCNEAKHAGDINELTASMPKPEEHRYYSVMRKTLLHHAKRLECTFNHESNKWIGPKEFLGITDEQRDELLKTYSLKTMLMLWRSAKNKELTAF